MLTGHNGMKTAGSEEEKTEGRIGLTQVSLVSDTGEVRPSSDLTPATSVRVTERDVNDEVGKYLGLVASTRDQECEAHDDFDRRRRRA